MIVRGLHIEQAGEDVLIWVKAVPGASHDEINGVVGDRLKIRISAAPEGGKANKAICKVLASSLGVKTNQISIERGETSPAKIVRVSGAVLGDVTSELT